MPNEGSIFSSLDVPHPDARLLLHFASIKIQCFIKWFRRDYFLFFCRLDWERQFFDENLDNPPNWEFQPVCFFSFNAFLNVELVSVNLLMIIKRIIRQIVTKSFFNFFLSKFFIFTFLWHSVQQYSGNILYFSEHHHVCAQTPIAYVFDFVVSWK